MESVSCFTHGTVVCDLASTEKYQAIHELLLNAPVFRDIEDIDYLERAVVHREHLQSTGLGNGIAVTHGKTPAVGNVVMALGISRPGIEFDALDGNPVHFLFLVANPPGMQLEYLLALSILARVIRDERFRDELLTCFDPFEIERRLRAAFRTAMAHRGFAFN